ncbi:MAG: hypothetical protein ACP5N3_00335 [Candidatus Nanoarchaeia archaeon]
MAADEELWEILVPRCSNEGLEYNLDYHHKWDEQVRGLAGGVTILRTAKGHWVNPQGQVFVEEMIPVRIYCNRETIDRIQDMTLEYYNQEAVFAYRVSSEVIVKHRNRN